MSEDKRNRSDSVAGQQEIVEGALSAPLDPPDCVTLTEAHRPFWDSIIKTKARRSWTQNDLILAADLARVEYQMEEISRELVDEPYCVAGSAGNLVINPKHKLLDLLARRAAMWSSKLQIHCEATQGKSREQRDQNEKHKEAMTGTAGSGDDLIARPKVH